MDELLVRLMPMMDLLPSIFLLSLRIGAALMMTPILTVVGIPNVVRGILILGISIGIVSNNSSPFPEGEFRSAVQAPGVFMQACFMELALGATLALGIHLAFSAFAIAGRLLDIQIGFGMAQVLDPVTRANLPVVTTAFNQLAVVVFFIVDGPQVLLRGLAFSVSRFPLGKPWPIGAAIEPVIRQAGGVLLLAFALAMPVVLAIVLIEFALGVLARNLPQMNMLALGIPVKIVAGLVTLALWTSGALAPMQRIYLSLFNAWDAVFAVRSTAGG